jgi:hypothetical protein
VGAGWRSARRWPSRPPISSDSRKGTHHGPDRAGLPGHGRHHRAR